MKIRIATHAGHTYFVRSVSFRDDCVAFVSVLSAFKFRGATCTKFTYVDKKIRLVNPKIEEVTFDRALAEKMMADAVAVMSQDADYMADLKAARQAAEDIDAVFRKALLAAS